MSTRADPKEIEIRLARPEDREIVIDLFFKLLVYLDQFEHDMLPTRENAEFVVDNFLMPAAARGEPILIAWDEAKPVGGVFWVIQDLPYKSRWKMAFGYGTYVEEEYRSQKLGTKIRRMGFEILKEKGVDRLTGMVLLKNRLSVENCDNTGAIPIARLDHFLVR